MNQVVNACPEIRTKKRIEWIDALKGFAMFCVVLCHLDGNFYFEQYIRTFNVLIFVFLSGLVHGEKSRGFKEYFISKTKSILLPFAVWNVLSVAFDIVMGADIGDSIRLLFLVDGHICWNSPIYFLLALYMTQIVYYFIARYIPKVWIKLCIVPVLVVLTWLVSPHLVFMKVNLVPMFLLFYLLGDLFAQYLKWYEGKQFRLKILWIPISAALLVLGIFFARWLSIRVSYPQARFGNIFYLLLAAVFNVAFYVLLFKNVGFIGKSRILAFFGANSLIIMATQYWLMKFLYSAMWRVPYGFYYYKRNGIMATIMSVLIMVVISVAATILKAIGKKIPIVKRVCGLLGIR